MARRSMMSDGPWIRLQDEVNQNPGVRNSLLRTLEKQFRARVVSFFVSFHDANGLITDADAEMLESLLAVEHKNQPLVLVLNAPGGMALAAERIVNVCRAYSGDKFEVVVPHMAKSAATMICFGASKIHMSKTAELGPVDPQVTYSDDLGRPRWISADEYVRAYDRLLEEATRGPAKRIEPYLQQLQRFDARQIESLRSAQALSADISVRLLESGMMGGVPRAKIKDRIRLFLAQEQTSSHGRMISASSAEGCGLKVHLLELHSPTWSTLWDLYVRSDWVVSHKCNKLLESTSSSLRA